MMLTFLIQCLVCKNKIEIEMTHAQLRDYHKGEKLIQEVFPEKSADEREILLSRICGKCFDKITGDDHACKQV